MYTIFAYILICLFLASLIISKSIVSTNALICFFKILKSSSTNIAVIFFIKFKINFLNVFIKFVRSSNASSNFSEISFLIALTIIKNPNITFGDKMVLRTIKGNPKIILLCKSDKIFKSKPRPGTNDFHFGSFAISSKDFSNFSIFALSEFSFTISSCDFLSAKTLIGNLIPSHPSYSTTPLSVLFIFCSIDINS